MYTLNHYMKSLYPSLSPSRDFSLSLPISLSLSLSPSAIRSRPHGPRGPDAPYLSSYTSILGVMYHQVIYHHPNKYTWCHISPSHISPSILVNEDVGVGAWPGEDGVHALGRELERSPGLLDARLH